MSVSNLLFDLVLSELKQMGIKHKVKKPKTIKISVEHRLFRQGLQYLKLANAFLENGNVVQIPQFLVEACSYILEHCETEGIFRRAGSAAKQREIRECLEAGSTLGRCHRVIDVANIVSYFFRELPEPLIPLCLHETLLRCLLREKATSTDTTADIVYSMQLTCLLMPSLTLQTLAYFMQFLNTITRHIDSNKMSAQNLAIVIAPSIMPYRDINSVRFKNHIKIVELFINNARVIGTVPVCFRERLGNTSNNLLKTSSIQIKNKWNECTRTPPYTAQKHRRSHIFSMLKTKVGFTNGIENLDSPAKQEDNSTSQDSGLNNKKAKRSRKAFDIISNSKNAETFKAFLAKKDEIMHFNGNSCEKSEINKQTWYLETANSSTINENTKMIYEYDTEIKSLSNNGKENNSTETIANTEHIPDTGHNELNAVVERVSSIKTQNDSPQETCGNNNIASGQICHKEEICNTRIKKRKNYEENSIHSLNVSTLSQIKLDTSHINKRDSCRINLASEMRASTSEDFKPQNIDDPQNDLFQLNEHFSNQWLPAETFFQNLDNFYTPVQKIKIHYESKTQGLENINKMLYSTKNNARVRSTNGSCRKDFLKKKSSTKIIVEDQGRASIARLRTENFGMVLARTKLFE